MRKAIYTAMFGSNDIWMDPEFVNLDYDYYLFTDRQDIKSEVFKVITMPGNQRKAREIKILSHRFLPDYDIWVWHDADFRQKTTMNEFTSLKNWELIIMHHPNRNCIYNEAEACIEEKKGNKHVITQQMNKYRRKGYPENNGMVATGFIIRKNTYRIRLLNERWWYELSKGSVRDQLSFNPSLYFINHEDGIKIVVKKIPYLKKSTHFHFKKLNY